MIASVETASQEIVKSLLQTLEKLWEQACLADDTHTKACQPPEISEEFYDKGRDEVKVLFEAVLKYIQTSQAIINSWPHKDSFQSELEMMAKKENQTHYYLIGGFVQLTSEEKIKIRKEREELEKMMREAGFEI